MNGVVVPDVPPPTLFLHMVHSLLEDLPPPIEDIAAI